MNKAESIRLVKHDDLVHSPLSKHRRGQGRICNLTRFGTRVASDKDARVVNEHTFLDDSALVQLAEIVPRFDLVPGRDGCRGSESRNGARHRIFLLDNRIGTERKRSKEATLNAGTIEQNAVVLVVSIEGIDGKHYVFTVGHLSTRHGVVENRTTQGSLAVAEHAAVCIKAVFVIGRIVADALFALGATQLVSRGLIVIRKRHHVGEESHHGTGMDLRVCVIPCQITERSPPTHVGFVAFIGINVFDCADVGF